MTSSVLLDARLDERYHPVQPVGLKFTKMGQTRSAWMRLTTSSSKSCSDGHSAASRWLPTMVPSRSNVSTGRGHRSIKPLNSFVFRP